MKSLLILISIFFVFTPSYASNFPAKDVYENIAPSVVVVKSSRAEGGGFIGAGSVISKDGHIITNAHVVIDKETGEPYPKIRAYLKPDKLTGVTRKDLSRSIDVKVLHYSRELDLALLKVAGLPSGIQVIELANASEIKIGEEVVAIGHPEQGGFWSLTYGRISGEMQDYQGTFGKDMYQTDTSVNRGNSGGPLLDRRGYMVAVNSNIARVGKGGLPITGVNFSIKSSVVKKWLGKKGYTIAYGETPLIEGGDVTVNLPEISEGDDQVEASKLEDSELQLVIPDDRILTPKIPYDYDNVLKAAEKDLEEMMDEMKKKIRGKTGGDFFSTTTNDKFEREGLTETHCDTSEEGLKICVAVGIAKLGDDTTLAIARAMALNNARRRALEVAVGVDLRSTSLIYNSELVSDLIVTSTKGLIVKEQILQEMPRIEGKQITYTVRIEAHIKPLHLERRGNFKIKRAEVFRVANPSVQKNPVFQDNDEIQMKIKVNSDAYLNIFSVDQYGKIIKLLPNPYIKSGIVPARTEFIYPNNSQALLGIKLKVKTPKNLGRAIESVLIIATKEKVDFLSDKNQEETTITDLMRELSELDPSLWIEKTIGYEVRR